MARKVSKNNTRTAWLLKGDIRKFFASVDHQILKAILIKHIKDNKIIWLLERIIDSYNTENTIIGLPLGNVTSQLFINVYMNEFDQFVKRNLKVQYYIRYCDDFVILHNSKQYLIDVIPKISLLLEEHLKLTLHTDKLFIKPLARGSDFLGWIHFPHHRILRTATKRRMFKKLKQNGTEATVASYLGLLKHGNTHKLTKIIRDNFDLDTD